jgi:hypothetical protein
MTRQSAIATRARHTARIAVREQLRRHGVKVSSVTAKEIAEAADRYLAEHRELIDRAKADIDRWIAAGAFGKRATRELETSARASEAIEGIIQTQ